MRIEREVDNVPAMSARTKEGHNRGSMRAMGGFRVEREYEVKNKVVLRGAYIKECEQCDWS
jgi:hypothetical protein